MRFSLYRDSVKSRRGYSGFFPVRSVEALEQVLKGAARNNRYLITQNGAKLKHLIVATAMFTAFGAIAGPLGLNKSMTLEELKRQGDFSRLPNQTFVYGAKNLIAGHPDFNSFLVVVTPEQGLCKIVASSKEIETSGFGTELQSKYKILVEALAEKYGAPGNTFDFLRNGSIWEEPRNWMMGLKEKERRLSAHWSKPQINNLPDSLASISTTAGAYSSSTGFISLVYEFDNFAECLTVMKSKTNSSL